MLPFFRFALILLKVKKINKIFRSISDVHCYIGTEKVSDVHFQCIGFPDCTGLVPMPTLLCSTVLGV